MVKLGQSRNYGERLMLHELRIGNLVYKNGSLYQIKELHSEISVIGGIPFISESLLYSGIPLDENWILKIGYTKNPDGWSFHEVMLSQRENDYLVSSFPHRSLNYVHELQNITYSLLGFETGVYY